MTHVPRSHAGDSVGRNVRIVQSSSSLAFLSSVRPVISYFHFYLASLLSSYIGDIKRFQSTDKLASFFGIVPSNRDSSSTIRRGHMSKEGSQTARWALSLAVDTVIMRNKPLKEYYTSVKKRKGSGSFAHVSTMRKLVRMIFVMLNERKKWKYEVMTLTEDKAARLQED